MESIGKVILLQGPVGPCFDKLHNSFLRQNIDCTRVLFNAGDRLFCRIPQSAIKFKGNLENWSTWFETYLLKNSSSVVILFGADRPIHSIARNLCKKLGVKVLCLEEGYFRPGYVTIEEGGNNACSPIAGQLPDFEAANDLETLDESHLTRISENSFRNRCWYGFLYYFWSELFSSNQQRKLFHKHLNLLDQAIGWMKNFILWKFVKKKDERLFQELSGQEYHLVALQLDADMQSRFQSNGWKKMDLIHETIQSFANTRTRNSHLVFKVHPLERGHYNHAKIIQNIAQTFGVEDRVWTIQTGSIGQWVKHSKGMITINSTSGFSAIFHGVPILLLGNAIYEHDQLVYKLGKEADFDFFWNVSLKASHSERMQYLNWVKKKSCVEGDFYSQLDEINIKECIISYFNKQY